MNNQYPTTESFQKLEALILSRGLKFTPQMQYEYFNDPMFMVLFTLLLELFEGRFFERKEMTDEAMTFVAKSLRSIQKQLDEITNSLVLLEKRVRRLEPEPLDEMVVKTADGRIALILFRDEEGNYVAPAED